MTTPRFIPLGSSLGAVQSTPQRFLPMPSAWNPSPETLASQAYMLQDPEQYRSAIGANAIQPTGGSPAGVGGISPSQIASGLKGALGLTNWATGGSIPGLQYAAPLIGAGLGAYQLASGNIPSGAASLLGAIGGLAGLGIAAPGFGMVLGGLLSSFLNKKTPLQREVTETLMAMDTVKQGVLPSILNASTPEEMYRVLTNMGTLGGRLGFTPTINGKPVSDLTLDAFVEALKGGSQIQTQIALGVRPEWSAPMNQAVASLLNRQAGLLSKALGGDQAAAQQIQANQQQAAQRLTQPLQQSLVGGMTGGIPWGEASGVPVLPEVTFGTMPELSPLVRAQAVAQPLISQAFGGVAPTLESMGWELRPDAEGALTWFQPQPNGG